MTSNVHASTTNAAAEQPNLEVAAINETGHSLVDPQAKFTTHPSQKHLREDHIAVSDRRTIPQIGTPGQSINPTTRERELSHVEDDLYGASRPGSSVPSPYGLVGDGRGLQWNRHPHYEQNASRPTNHVFSDTHNLGDRQSRVSDGLIYRGAEGDQQQTQNSQHAQYDRQTQYNPRPQYNQQALSDSQAQNTQQTNDNQQAQPGQHGQGGQHDANNENQPREEGEKELIDSRQTCPCCKAKHDTVKLRVNEVSGKSAWLPRKKRVYGISAGYLILIGIAAALAVLYAKSASTIKTNAPSLGELTVNTYQPKDAVPVVGSSLGVTEMILGSYFTRDHGAAPDVKAMYEASNGRLCMRTRSKDVWLDKIRCVEGARPKKLTPIAVIDSIAGLSIGNINDEGYLLSINYIPDDKNDTWTMSTLRDQKIKPSPNSRLSCTTWLRGLAGWFNYQDPGPDFLLRERGYDDFRFVRWRDSSGGPLGKAQEGSSFGISRYMIGDAEYEEIIFQSNNGAFQSRKYVNGVWNEQEFSISGTEKGIELGARMTATTVSNNNASTILLVYVAGNGFITTQTRSTGSTVDSRAYSPAQQIIQTDGADNVGLAADGASGIPRIYFFKDQKLMILESDISMNNWTTTEVSFA